MAFEITKVEVWEGEIEDRAGGLAEKLAEVMRTGANLDVIISRPCPATPGWASLFLAPLHGEEQTGAARQAGLKRSTEQWIRVEGPDRPWLAAGIAQTLADAGINMRGLSGSVVRDRCVIYISFDSDVDARRAAQTLTPVLG
jgi:hypothetical protein